MSDAARKLAQRAQFFRLDQCFTLVLGFLSRGDVHGCPQQTARPTRLIVEHAAAVRQASNRAIWPLDAALDAQLAALLDRLR
jgi:hypothetical protein